MLTINEAIRKIVRKFEDENGFIKLIRYSRDDFDLSFSLEDEIEFLMTGLNLIHKIELIEAYENGSKNYYVLCVSYVYNGTLETYNIPVNN